MSDGEPNQSSEVGYVVDFPCSLFGLVGKGHRLRGKRVALGSIIQPAHRGRSSGEGRSERKWCRAGVDPRSRLVEFRVREPIRVSILVEQGGVLCQPSEADR